MATENETGPFTPAYLRKEICDFRELLGQKTFWAKPQANRQAALDALGVVYLQMTATAEEIDEMALHYHGAVSEYLRREMACTMNGIPIGL